MGQARASDSEATMEQLRRALRGDQAAWERLLERHRDRLRRMIALRLDRRLRGRVDPSDVIQEAHLEAAVRLGEYLQKPEAPFFLWLRYLAGQRLIALHRRHLGAKARDAGREVGVGGGVLPEATSAALAARLLGHDTGPSEAAIRAEREARLREALDRLDPLDREVLALRHFEQLTNSEAAQVLRIPAATAYKRHVRALRRLKEALAGMRGGLEELLP
jgi:RNA polymerase sigma-70 factor (ECF subfamily)